MGFVHKNHGNISIETRSESFYIHAGYEEGEVLAEFWRDVPHPEFLLSDLEDLIAALEEVRAKRESA
jgi:hypothetical protein